MISDKLYTMAFEFRKTKIWNNVWDVHVFAIKLSDGNIGYINITNSSNGHYSLGLYLGDKGFNSLRTITEIDKLLVNPFSPFKFQETLLQQECLKCIFVSKNQLMIEEIQELNQYTSNHDIRLRGKNAYPQFIKYIANCIPVINLNEQEQEYLCEAFSACIFLTDMLDGKMAATIGMTRIFDDSDEILSIELKNGEYIIGHVPYPESPSLHYPSPKAANEIAIAKLKRENKVGIWECELIRFPRPIQNDPEEIPFYPIFLMAVENTSNYFLPIPPVSCYEKNPEELINHFIDSLLKQKICPSEIRVRDERTYSFAKDLCEKLKIPLTMDENLEFLEEAEFLFWDRFGIVIEEEEEEVSEIMKNIINEQKENAKKEKEYKNTKTKSANFRNKITSIAPTQSYIISVSFGTGCYRHIQISGINTLFDLHSFILNVFEFDDEHQHAFFMNNKLWSSSDCYFADSQDSDYVSTCDCKLNQAGLLKGKQFKYVYDFGDQWVFQCKVLQIIDGDTEKPILLKSKGKPPVQYEFDEYDDDLNDINE